MREELLRTLLLIDSDAGERRLVAATASRAGWSLVGANSPEAAREALEGPHGREVRAVLLSGWKAESGGELVRWVRADRPDMPIIVLADQEAIPLAVEAMRAGASDFLVKPVAPERLLEALNVHRDRRRPVGELAPLSEKLAHALPLDELVKIGREHV